MSISDDVLALLKELSINHTSLNKSVPSSVKRAFKRKVKEWQSKGIVSKYFKYLLDQNKYTYSDILRLSIYAIYEEKHLEIFEETKNLYVVVANDCYSQAKKELPKVPKDIPEILAWAYISKWLKVFSMNCTFEEYLETLVMTDVEETYSKCIQSINNDRDLTLEDISKTLEKQKNRVLNVSEDKYSGVVDTMARTVGNKAYTEPFPNEKVLFIAEMDERTTKMCTSLNGQVFNTKDNNKFTRYSDSQKGIIEYDIDGLVDGINLPPINDNFHWCRSTLTYNF